jgi:hypothetical protein
MFVLVEQTGIALGRFVQAALVKARFVHDDTGRFI